MALATAGMFPKPRASPQRPVLTGKRASWPRCRHRAGVCHRAGKKRVSNCLCALTGADSSGDKWNPLFNLSDRRPAVVATGLPPPPPTPLQPSREVVQWCGRYSGLYATLIQLEYLAEDHHDERQLMRVHPDERPLVKDHSDDGPF